MHSYEINDTGRECTQCRNIKNWAEFCKGSSARGRSSKCRECRNLIQKNYRRLTKNLSSKKYEKTKKGFLVRLYRNMQSRVTGVKKDQFYLYAGCRLLDRKDFYRWAENNEEFHRLFAAWEASGYELRSTPAVSRIDTHYGYELWNMEWVTQSETSRRGAMNRWNKR